MILLSLDSSRHDESNDSKIIPIGAIFAEITIFAKFQVGSGRVNCLTRPEFSGQVGSGTQISGQKCGALGLRHRELMLEPVTLVVSKIELEFLEFLKLVWKMMLEIGMRAKLREKIM